MSTSCATYVRRQARACTANGRADSAAGRDGRTAGTASASMPGDRRAAARAARSRTRAPSARRSRPSACPSPTQVLRRRVVRHERRARARSARPSRAARAGRWRRSRARCAAACRSRARERSVVRCRRRSRRGIASRDARASSAKVRPALRPPDAAGRERDEWAAPIAVLARGASSTAARLGVARDRGAGEALGARGSRAPAARGDQQPLGVMQIVAVRRRASCTARARPRSRSPRARATPREHAPAPRCAPSPARDTPRRTTAHRAPRTLRIDRAAHHSRYGRGRRRACRTRTSRARRDCSRAARAAPASSRRPPARASASSAISGVVSTMSPRKEVWMTSEDWTTSADTSLSDVLTRRHAISRPAAPRGTLPAGSRPSRPASCASFLPSASRGACACGVMSPP